MVNFLTFLKGYGEMEKISGSVLNSDCWIYSSKSKIFIRFEDPGFSVILIGFVEALIDDVISMTHPA